MDVLSIDIYDFKTAMFMDMCKFYSRDFADEWSI